MSYGGEIRWEIAGVSLTLLLASVDLSPVVMIAIAIVGSILLLLALGLPQRLTRKAARAITSYIKKVQVENNAMLVKRHCETVATNLSTLLSSPAGGKTIGGFRLANPFRIRGRLHSIVGAYETQHQALTVSAVEEALKAGAANHGVLQKARAPRDVSDLHEVLAGLLRIAGELSSAPLTPAESIP